MRSNGGVCGPYGPTRRLWSSAALLEPRLFVFGVLEPDSLAFGGAAVSCQRCVTLPRIWVGRSLYSACSNLLRTQTHAPATTRLDSTTATLGDFKFDRICVRAIRARLG